MSGVASIIPHHTAGPATGEAPSLGVVQNGRTGLPGPLSQLVLGRSGTVYVVAAGLAYHAGLTFEIWQSNAWSIGIEAEATGTSTWPSVQYDAYVRLCRALADHYRVPYSRVMGHKEVASPRGRKVDPNFEMATFRAAIAMTKPVTTQVEEDMSWTDIVTNAYGDKVQAIQVLNGVEVRAADAQDRVGRVDAKVDSLSDRVNALTAAIGGLVPGTVTELECEPIDLDALAAKVADLLAERLAN
jgi:hypothetical protein